MSGTTNPPESTPVDPSESLLDFYIRHAEHYRERLYYAERNVARTALRHSGQLQFEFEEEP
jgi:hypothetical protein